MRQAAGLEEVNVRVDVARQDEFAVTIDRLRVFRDRSGLFFSQRRNAIALNYEDRVWNDAAGFGINDGAAGENNFLRVKLGREQKQGCGKNGATHGGRISNAESNDKARAFHPQNQGMPRAARSWENPLLASLSETGVLSRVSRFV